MLHPAAQQALSARPRTRLKGGRGHGRELDVEAQRALVVPVGKGRLEGGGHHRHHARAPQRHGAPRVVERKLEGRGAQLVRAAAVHAQALAQGLRSRAESASLRAAGRRSEHKRRRRRRALRTCMWAGRPLAACGNGAPRATAHLDNELALVVAEGAVGVALQRRKGPRHVGQLLVRSWIAMLCSKRCCPLHRSRPVVDRRA